jgi:membrane protein YdbS with pleckstrin-like domain
MTPARTPCPYCGESIAAEARKCRFCGEWLTDGESRTATSADGAGDAEFGGYAGPGASAGRAGSLFKREPWSLQPNESVVTRSQPYPRRVILFFLALQLPALFSALLLPAEIFMTLLVVCWIIAAGVWLNYRLERIEWILTDRRLIVVRGWLTRTAKSVSLDKINEANYTRGLLARLIFATGTIAVETAATEGTTRLSLAADDDPFREALEWEIGKRRSTVARAA